MKSALAGPIAPFTGITTTLFAVAAASGAAWAVCTSAKPSRAENPAASPDVNPAANLAVGAVVNLAVGPAANPDTRPTAKANANANPTGNSTPRAPMVRINRRAAPPRISGLREPDCRSGKRVDVFIADGHRARRLSPASAGRYLDQGWPVAS